MFKRVFLIGTSALACTLNSKLIFKKCTRHSILHNRNIFLKCYAAPWISNWDEREHTSNNFNLKRKLIFIHHGEYEKSGPNRGKLTNEGRIEMKSSAKRLLELVQDKNCHIRVLNSSTYKRTVESAEVIRQFLSDNEIKCVPDINQTDCSGECRPFDSSRYMEIDTSYKDVPGYFKSSALAEAAFRNFFFRPQSPYNEKEHSTIPIEIYVGHSNLHKWFFHRALQLPQGGFLNYSCKNGGFLEFTVHGNGYVTCDCISQSAFVFKDKLVSNLVQNKIKQDGDDINEEKKIKGNKHIEKCSHNESLEKRGDKMDFGAQNSVL